MAEILVPASHMAISDNPDDVLVSAPLATCLGLTAYDPELKLGGLVHCLLPHASLLRGQPTRDNPAMFVNTGVAMLVRRLRERGAARERLVFKGAGGAMMETESLYMTGEHNQKALMRILALNRARLAGHDLGGRGPRTMRLYLDTGRVVVTRPGGTREI